MKVEMVPFVLWLPAFLAEVNLYYEFVLKLANFLRPIIWIILTWGFIPITIDLCR